MATLYIREYARAAVDGRGGMVLAGEEPGTDQAPITFSGVSTLSVAFASSTKFIRLNTDATCSFRCGDSTVTATTNNARMAANQTEFFGLSAGATYLAVISNT